MLNIVRFLALILIVAAAAGCVPKSTSFSPTSPQPDKALVYIYRQDAFLNRAETMYVHVNGNKVGDLWVNQHIYAHVQPGDATIVLNKNVWPNNEYGRLTVKDLKAGETYYIKCDPIVMAGFSVINMPKEQGLSEIRSTLYYLPE